MLVVCVCHVFDCILMGVSKLVNHYVPIDNLPLYELSPSIPRVNATLPLDVSTRIASVNAFTSRLKYALAFDNHDEDIAKPPEPLPKNVREDVFPFVP